MHHPHSKLMTARRWCVGLAAMLSASMACAVALNLAEVGDTDNSPDLYSGSLYGAVPYRYSIGIHPVTASQFAEFLNAKDPDGLNTLRLYAVGMGDATYGSIKFTPGNASGRKYAAVNGRDKWPMTYISFYNALRFANWMHNGQGAGDTETGAYVLGALDANAVPVNPPVTHAAGARFWVPTEDEWYKAAFHRQGDGRPEGYFEYGTGSSVKPTGALPGSAPNTANITDCCGGSSGPGVPTPVGAYTANRSPYGAYDMAGNVYQWTEAVIGPLSGGARGIRGGSYAGTVVELISTARFSYMAAWDIGRNAGFRLASSDPGVVYVAPPAPPPAASNTIEVKSAGGKGLITSVSGAINCGKVCTAAVDAGTMMTLSAVPEVGFRFVSWTGACTGISPTCVVQVFGRTQSQANFSK